MSSVLLFGLIAPGTIFRNREYKITSWEMSFKILGQDECPALLEEVLLRSEQTKLGSKEG